MIYRFETSKNDIHIRRFKQILIRDHVTIEDSFKFNVGDLKTLGETLTIGKDETKLDKHRHSVNSHNNNMLLRFGKI